MHFSAGRVVGKVGVEPPIPAVSASPDIGMVGVEPSNLQLPGMTLVTIFVLDVSKLEMK